MVGKIKTGLLLLASTTLLSSCSFSFYFDGSSAQSLGEAQTSVDFSLSKEETKFTVRIDGADKDSAISLLSDSPIFDGGYMSAQYSIYGKNITYYVSYGKTDEGTLKSGQDPKLFKELEDMTFSFDSKGKWDSFPIDSRETGIAVKTSEQLWMTAQSAYRPEPVAGSAAESVYSAVKSRIKERVPKDSDDAEKAAAYFSVIAAKTQYDWKLSESTIDSPYPWRGHLAEGSAIDGLAVCDGFAKEYSLALNIMGIPCLRMSGTSKTDSKSGHAWDVAKIGGAWRNADPTMADVRIYGVAEACSWSSFLGDPSDMLDSFDMRSGYVLPEGEDYGFFESKGMEMKNAAQFDALIATFPKSGPFSCQAKISYCGQDGAIAQTKASIAAHGLESLSVNWNGKTSTLLMMRV